MENIKINTAEKLLSIESIFSWKPTILDENLNEITCEFEPQSKNQFNLYNFIIRLVNCYKSYKDTELNNEAALNQINELIHAADEFNEDGDGGYFIKIRNAYYHILYASKSYLFIKENKHQEAIEIINKIKPFDEMDNCNKAAVHAIKSAVFALFSNEDMQKGLASIDKALQYDERGQWYFLKGIYNRRIRRINNPFESPSLQEREQFEKAFEKEPSNVVFKLHLADVYRENAKHASQRSDLCSHFLPIKSFNDNLKTTIDQKIQKAAQFFREAAEEFPASPYVMFRAADGLAKLPQGSNDIKLAKKLTKDGLKLAPDNVCGNLVQAFISEKFDKNTKEAIKHLKICTQQNIFEADMNMLRILYSTKPEKLNCIEVLNELIKKYKEKERHAILYAQMVSYYLVIEYNLIEANENAKRFYKLGTKSTFMKKHRSCFFVSPEPFSLIDVLIDQVKYVLNGNRISEPEKKNCREFLQFMNFLTIDIIRGPPQNFLKQIKEGKLMKDNPKCSQKPFKNFDQTKKGISKKNDKRSDNGCPYPSNKGNFDNSRSNQAPPMKAPNKTNQLPSLMDIPVSKPVAKNEENHAKEETPAEDAVEKPAKKRSEEEDDSSSDSKTEKMIRNILKELKKKKKSQPENKSKSRNEDEESILRLLKQMGIGSGKSTHGKKHHSDSDSETESDYKKRKDRRRERSRRRHRSRSSSNDSEKYRRRHRRHKHHSSDSENSSRSVRRKSHKKDRSKRDYSPHDKHHRRRHRSSEDDYDYKSAYRRDDSVSTDSRKRRHRDSVSSRPTRDRSLSYEKRGRSSPKKYERRRERKSSADSRNRSASRDKHSRRTSSPKKEKSHRRQRKISSEREEIEITSGEKKSRRRSSSRDKPQSRGSRSTKSKKEGESSKNSSKRDQNSSRRSSDESDSRINSK